LNALLIISESLGYLQKLSVKSEIFLDDVPKEFKPDLQNYIVGETLCMRNEKILIGHNLYKKWLAKIRSRGFDYEIDFNQ
jgi:hypothetical protein